MTSGEVKFASVAFAMMTLSVAINVFFMQGERSDFRHGLSGGGSRIESLAGPSDSGPAASGAAQPLKVAPPVAPALATSALPPVNSAELTRGIQRELNQRGYDAGPPDGVAGQVTRAAILAYEFDYGLELSAEPSQELLSRIILGTSAPPQAVPNVRDRSVGPAAQELIRSVQKQLQGLGYSVGAIDGRPGEQLSRAIRAFEIDQKLKDSGRISGPLLSRLVRMQVQAPRVTRGQTAAR